MVSVALSSGLPPPPRTTPGTSCPLHDTSSFPSSLSPGGGPSRLFDDCRRCTACGGWAEAAAPMPVPSSEPPRSTVGELGLSRPAPEGVESVWKVWEGVGAPAPVPSCDPLSTSNHPQPSTPSTPPTPPTPPRSPTPPTFGGRGAEPPVQKLLLRSGEILLSAPALALEAKKVWGFRFWGSGDERVERVWELLLSLLLLLLT